MMTDSEIARIAKIPLVGPFWADAVAVVQCMADALRIADLHEVLEQREMATPTRPLANADAANHANHGAARAA